MVPFVCYHFLASSNNIDIAVLLTIVLRRSPEVLGTVCDMMWQTFPSPYGEAHGRGRNLLYAAPMLSWKHFYCACGLPKCAISSLIHRDDLLE